MFAKSSWLLRPVTIFVFSLLALGTSLYLYITSYLRVNDAFAMFVRKHNLDARQLLDSHTWVTILILSVLVGSIILGFTLVFVYYQKLIQLYRMQQNFISGFTHELKTPIASIRLFLDTFSRHDLPREEALKYIQFMKKDTDRLATNVDQILNLAKIEEKKYEPNLTSVNLNQYMSEIVEKSHSPESGRNIYLNPFEKDLRVQIDPPLFEMMIMNLINNAFVYNHGDNKKLDIDLSSDHFTVMISFTDNGMGIEPSEYKKIFRKFYQVGKTSKGSGLGLYLVGVVAKLHGGSVDASSPGLGAGTTFQLTLPLSLGD